MIDQASVFADRFRNNRQALQAAVLGQNSGVDPYTALRALQLLKESDSMQMAQQGQQPTESPSLLQEAMQPQGMMPAGQPVPGQQMPQAPQQSGGLEAMPVPEQDFADGGIIAFAAGDSIPKASNRAFAAFLESMGKTSRDFIEASPQEKKALQTAFEKTVSGPRASSAAPSAASPATDTGSKPLSNRAGRAVGQGVRRFGPAVALGAEAVENFGKFKFSTDDDIDTSLSGTVKDYSEGEYARMLKGLGIGAGEALLDSGSGLAGLVDYALPGQPAQRAYDKLVRGTFDLKPDPNAPSAPPKQNPLRAQEAEANIAYGPEAAPEAAPVVPAPPPDKQDASTADGLGALAAPTYTPASRDRLNAALDAQAAFKPTESTITPPRGLQEKITALKGDKGSLKALEGLFGDDEASTKAQKLLDKRLKELEDPDRNKFEKALGFFKAAGALQKTIDKDGRRVTPMGAAAEAMGEVASVYSGIRKEDRKAKQLIEDAQMAVDKAGQARKDGLTGKALDLENKADEAKTAAETAQARINAQKDQAKATLLAAVTTSEGAAYSGDRSANAQVYASELSRLSAQERNITDEKMRKLAAERLVTDKNLAAYNAASETLRKAEADVNKAMEADTDLRSVIDRIRSYERKAAKNELDQKEMAALKNSRAKRAQLEKRYADQLEEARERFNAISSRVISASDASAGGNDQEAAARQWLKNNPNDPRAAAIRKKLGM